MGVVVKAADGGGRNVERLLAGMTEWCVPEIVRKAERFGEILIDCQHTCNRPGDLRHLERMGQPRAVIIALVLDEDLGLVLQAAKSGGMDDTVTVALVTAPGGAFRLRIKTPPARLRPRRVGG